jgi:EAL domain-containing protein (putative c-di-GMP-specific phosphodiesterase class I)
MDQSIPLTAPETPLADYGAVCLSLRAALEPARSHAISLHDEHGDVLWLSEGSMGPDEHNAVREAMETFADPNAAPVLGIDLGDSRCAVMVRAIDGRCNMVGAVMFVMDSRVIARGATKLMTPKLQRALSEFVAMRPVRAVAAPTAAQRAAAVSNAASSKTALPPTAASHTATPRTAPPQTAPLPKTSGAAVDSIELTLAATDSYERPSQAAAARAALASPPRPVPPPTLSPMTPSPALARAQKGVTPEIDRLHAALRKSPIALHVQRLMPLSKGSMLKRYEVLLRSKSESAPNVAPQAMLKAAVDNGLGSMIDRRVITELIGWLVHHPHVWENNEAMFSVNLTRTALQDDHFIKFIELCLAKSSLPQGTIAFEIDSPTALTLADRISEVAAALHRLGCPLILDDFALRTECFALLRLPGVRYVKLAPQITAKMRTDKISQAAITAVVQMARVLGMHTVAKHTDIAAEHEWLTALGVDFVQSNSMSPPIAIESLQKAAATKH